VRKFSVRPTLTIKGRTFKGVRGWSGKPFRPPLADFPIVAYVVAETFDVISVVGASACASMTSKRRLSITLHGRRIITSVTRGN